MIEFWSWVDAADGVRTENKPPWVRMAHRGSTFSSPNFSHVDLNRQILLDAGSQ
jgi:hypothetical protein